MSTIRNIRYGPIVEGHGTIEFDCIATDGQETVVRIKEPADVLLVDGGAAAEKWIARRYSFLLPA